MEREAEKKSTELITLCAGYADLAVFILVGLTMALVHNFVGGRLGLFLVFEVDCQ